MPAAKSGQLDEVCRQAQERWPEVCAQWGRAAYAAHARGKPSRFPLDLYLAGAAGHRVQPAWAVIEEELGPETRRVLQRQPIADYTTDDLWADTVARLMGDDADAKTPPLPDGRRPARMVRYKGLVKLLNFMVLVGKRIAIQRDRRLRPALSLDATPGSDAGDDGAAGPGPREVADADAPDPDAGLREADAVRAMRDALSKAFAGLAPEIQFLITMVYRCGMKQKDAGEKVGWSEFKVSRELKKAMEGLRDAVTSLSDVPWTPTLAAAWEGCVQECWKNVQESPPKASVRLMKR